MNTSYVLVFSNMHPDGVVLKRDTYTAYIDLLDHEDRQSVTSLELDEAVVLDVLKLIESV